MELSFILIDDSELDCFIARKIIAHTGKNIFVQSYQNPKLAMDAIKDMVINDADLLTIILLDLVMPEMSGFEFIEEFEKLSAETQKQFKVVVLSSTRNASDLARIMNFSSIHSTVEKPLTIEKLYSLILQVQLGDKNRMN